VRSLDAIELFRICATDTENSEAWSEFLRRYSVKIKYFIKGTLRQLSASSSPSSSIQVFQDGTQESDLFQNAIIRLVANNCAAMRRFSGKDESEVLAYLAVICRSAVLDTLRGANAARRGTDRRAAGTADITPFSQQRLANHDELDRGILVRELASFTQSAREPELEKTMNRDRLVFDLHFLHGLSCRQISQCKGIDLSKAGVEKLLKRVIARVQILAGERKQNETVL
jgi:RNA polymerase sigma factor (sigma-70 family)